MRTLLTTYLEQRILFYTLRDSQRLGQVHNATVRLQDELWSAVEAAAIAQPSPLTALVASATNNVLDAEGYTQAMAMRSVRPWRTSAVIRQSVARGARQEIYRRF